jgi:hypothetical protein
VHGFDFDFDRGLLAGFFDDDFAGGYGANGGLSTGLRHRWSSPSAGRCLICFVCGSCFLEGCNLGDFTGGNFGDGELSPGLWPG